MSLRWRHDWRDGVSNHQPRDCSLNCLFRRRWRKTSKLRVTCLFEWNSLVTGEFLAQRASNVENVCIWWHHHGTVIQTLLKNFSVVKLTPRQYCFKQWLGAERSLYPGPLLAKRIFRPLNILFGATFIDLATSYGNIALIFDRNFLIVLQTWYTYFTLWGIVVS